jgi:hypothetical protein
MKKNREERIPEYNRILSLRQLAESKLQHIPAVVKVSVGLKVIKRQPTEELCFRIYVNKKKSTSEILPHELIPLSIDNIKTDVNELPTNVTACAPSDTKKYRPLAGGTKVFSSRSFAEAGTMGCIAIDNESDNAVLLSNYHILMINGETQGHQVAQPKFYCDKSPCRCGEVARIERGFLGDDSNVDAAIATLTGKHQEKWTNEVLELGAVAEFPLDSDGKPVNPPTPGDTVFKRGMSTSLTEGLIIEVGGDDDEIEVGYVRKDGTEFIKTFKGQLKIGPKNVDKPFTRKGDSGAVIVNDLNQVIGLHFADNEERDGNNKVLRDAFESYANPIWDVVKALDIYIPDTGTLLSMPLNQMVAAPETDLMEQLETTLAQHPDGKIVIDAFKEHGDEILELVNTDREVTVAWHRCKGPSFVAHILERARNPQHEIPTAIDGISYQRVLSKMSVVLEKKGSCELAAVVEQYSTKAFSVISAIIHSSIVIKT